MSFTFRRAGQWPSVAKPSTISFAISTVSECWGLQSVNLFSAVLSKEIASGPRRSAGMAGETGISDLTGGSDACDIWFQLSRCFSFTSEVTSARLSLAKELRAPATTKARFSGGMLLVEPQNE